MRFLKHRINDTRMIRLIQKWLKAGVLEDGVLTVRVLVYSILLTLLMLSWVFIPA